MKVSLGAKSNLPPYVHSLSPIFWMDRILGSKKPCSGPLRNGASVSNYCPKEEVSSNPHTITPRRHICTIPRWVLHIIKQRNSLEIIPCNTFQLKTVTTVVKLMLNPLQITATDRISLPGLH